MSVRTDVINLQVNVNGNPAQNQLNLLRKKAADLTFEMQGLKKGTAEYIAKATELKQVENEMDSLRKQIGLTSLTQKELYSELRKLQALKSIVTPQTKEFFDLQKQIDAVNKRLFEVKNGVFGLGAVFSKVKEEVKQFGILAASYLGFQFLTSQFTNIIKGAGKLSDELAGVSKTTGLSNAEVLKLNKSLTELDTRTSTSNLRNIARVGGQLGIAKEDILSFTVAVDKLNVALGDEFGGGTEEITNTVGKIRNTFSELRSDKVDEDLLKIGNGLNVLGKDGLATAPVVSDFAQRIGAAGQVYGLTAGQTFGLSAALQELSVTAERGGTAVVKVLQKISAAPDKFYKIAASVDPSIKSLNDFKELVNTDISKAFILVSEGFAKNKGQATAFAESLADANISSASIAEVLSKVGSNSELVANKINVATEALSNSKSITDQFNIVNNTFGASLDKLGKEFNKFITSPGITNFLTGAVEGALKFIDVLRGIPKFLDENSTALQLLIVGIALLNLNYIKGAIAIAANTAAKIYNNIATRASTIATAASEVAQASYIVITNLLTGRIALATAAQRLWSIALSLGLGPLGILISLIGAAVVAYNVFSGANEKVNTALSFQAETIRESNKEIAKQRAELEGLTAVVTSNNLSLGTREASLQKLIEISPEYLNRLTLENIATDDGRRILDNYNKALEASANIKAANAIKERESEKDTKLRTIKQELEIYKATKDFSGLGDDAKEELSQGFGTDPVEVALKNVQNKIDKQSSNVKAATDNYVTQTKNQEDARRAFLVREITLDKQEQLAAENGSDSYKKATARLIEDRIKFDKEFGSAGKTKTVDTTITDIDSSTDDKKKTKAEKDFDKAESEMQRLRKQWEDLQRDINDSFALLSNDPFARDLSKVNREAEDEQNKLKLFLNKKVISQQEYADASVRIEEIRLKKIHDLIVKYNVTVTDPDFEPGKTKDITKPVNSTKPVTDPNYTDLQRGLAKNTRDVLAGEELDAITKNGRKKLEALLNILNIQKAQELANTNLTENEKALIEEKYRQKAAEASLQSFRDRAAAIADAAQQILSIGSSLSNAISNNDNSELAKEKSKNDAKADSYKKLLDHKLISDRRYSKLLQDQDQEYEKKKASIDAKAFKRQQALAITGALINGAMAVTSTLAARPGLADIFTLGTARALQVGLVIAATAAQIAEISSQKPPEAAKGGIFKGPSHKDGGMTVYDNRTGKPTVEVEGEEPFLVLSKNTLKNNGPIIHKLLDVSLNKNGASIEDDEEKEDPVETLNRTIRKTKKTVVKEIFNSIFTRKDSTSVSMPKAAYGGVFRSPTYTTTTLLPKWKTMTYPQINLNKILPILANGGIVNNAGNVNSSTSNSNTSTSNDNNVNTSTANVKNVNISASPVDTSKLENLLTELIAAQEQNKNDLAEALNNFRLNIKSHVVYKEITDAGALLDKAKSAAGINKSNNVTGSNPLKS